MPRKLIRVGVAVTPTEEIVDAAIVVNDGTIEAVGRRAAIDAAPGTEEISATEQIAVPGFIDVHIHGAAGHDVMEGTSDALDEITVKAAAHGTTSIVATTVTAPPDKTCRAIEDIVSYIKQRKAEPGSARAEVLGLHFEGPFISPARAGVHPKESIAEPSRELLDRMVQSAGGYARIITLAPELPGAIEFIVAADSAGMLVAMGHTDATYEQACAGVNAGIRHAAHVFNAMRPFSHRGTGVLGAVLTDRRVTAEIIADGIHVDFPAIKLLLAAKGARDVILISDGTAGTGMPDGAYKLGGLDFVVTGGVCRDSAGRLAGSTLTLDHAVRNIVSMGVSLSEAVRMATINPARRLGIEKQKGVLAPGADADIVLVNRDLTVRSVFVRGTKAA
jgi:N-acetylglucosamine-6-phosphate deacetylase